MFESGLLTELLIIAIAFAMAALPIGRRPVASRRRRIQSLGADVGEPSSLLSFVALPTFLVLVTLARFGVFVDTVEPVNSPDSGRRLSGAPEGVDIDIVLEGGEHHLRYPRNTAELTVAAASRADVASNPERIRAIRDLAWWTAVCPGYVPFTLPRLAHALRDPDPGVKGAAAIGLGSIGNHAVAALPDLAAARGTSVRHFDHLVAEAVVLIENTPRWPSATECEDASLTQLESRSP